MMKRLLTLPCISWAQTFESPCYLFKTYKHLLLSLAIVLGMSFGSTVNACYDNSFSFFYVPNGIETNNFISPKMANEIVKNSEDCELSQNLLSSSACIEDAGTFTVAIDGVVQGTSCGTFDIDSGSEITWTSNGDQVIASGANSGIVFVIFDSDPSGLDLTDPSTFTGGFGSSVLGGDPDNSSPYTTSESNCAGISGTNSSWPSTVWVIPITADFASIPYTIDTDFDGCVDAGCITQLNYIYTNNTTLLTCGDTFYDTGGPSGDYCNNETNSSWQICPSTPGDMVTVTFNSFETEGIITCYDELSVYNGDDNTAPLIGDYCEPGLGPFTSTAASGCLYFEFSSDASVTDFGWEADVSCAGPPPPPCDCTNPVCGGMHWDCASDAEFDFDFGFDAEYDINPDLPTANGTSYELCYDYTTGPMETSIGFVNAIGNEFGSNPSCTFDRVYHVYESCGTEVTSTGPSEFGTGFEYNVSPNTTYQFCVEITYTSGVCGNLENTYVWLYDANGGGGGCGTCAAPCTGDGMGSVATYDDRDYQSCWSPDCDIEGPTTFTNCFDATADASGFLGFANQIQILFSGCMNISWELTAQGDCGNIIANPVPNANGVGSGFNPEYSGLTPNGTYTLCVTYDLPDFLCFLEGGNNPDFICIDSYGNDCSAILEGTSSNGTSCQDDGVDLATTIGWTQTDFDAGPNADGTETTGFLVFCSMPTLPLTEAYYDAFALPCILEDFDSIGDFIDSDGNYQNPCGSGTITMCTDEIYLLPITISQSGPGGFIIDWSCFDTDEPVLVQLGVPPTADATADPTTICDGESSELTATGGGTYEWSNSLGTNPVVTVMPSTTTTYTVSVTDESGLCTTTAEVTVTVDDPGPEPMTECWETATLNPATCSWDITGTQPVEPTGLQCWEMTNFNNTTCMWEITGTQPTEPTVACYESTNFNTTSCLWEITGTQPTEPTGLQCWEMTNFNTTSCMWEITGTQPTEPTVACYESTNFNTTSCMWEVTGTQPTEPTVACYEMTNFNTTSCMWDVTGTQPTEPNVACYEMTNFNTTTCMWEVTGTQDPPPATECYESATFNNTTCMWVVTGTQPTEPTVACYESTNFNTTSCLWEVTGTQPTEPTGLQCWEMTNFNTTTCMWEITGTQPTEPNVACYEMTNFNTTTCMWDVTGTQPTEPNVACYEMTNFNTTTCMWDVTGTQDPPPATECYESATFNNTSCMWVVTGTQPTEPTVACYETTNFNNTSCMWEVTGTQPTEPTGLQCWEMTNFNTTSCLWEITGTQPTEPTGLQCWEMTNFNTTTCMWNVTGTQPVEPTVECYEMTNFNTTSCMWEVTGTPPTPPTFTLMTSYCVGDTPEILPTTSDNLVVGTWSPATINTANSNVTNYIFTPSDGCTAPFNISITVDDCGCVDPAMVSIDPALAICEDEIADLTAILGGSATSLTWSTGGDGSFDNTTSTTPMYTPGATDITNGSVTLSVITDDPDGVVGPCTPATAPIVLMINSFEDPTFNIDIDYCEGDVTDLLPTNSNNGIAGTWSPATISNVNSDMYLFTPDAGECANPFMLNVTVTPSNTPVFTVTNTYCINDAADALPLVSDNGVAGTWSPTSISTGSAGTTNYFFTPTNSCDDPLIQGVTVTACGCMNPAIVNIDPITSICENETIALNAVLSGTATTATWSTAGDGSFDNTTSTTPIYTPGATDIVNGAVSLSVLTDDPDGAGPCTSATASVLLLIDNLVNPTFSIENSYCEGDVTDVLPANSNNGIAGTWSPATISNVNSDMYEFTPDVGECANPFMLNVTVNPNNTPVFTITNTYCVNDPADVLPTTSNNGVVGTWSPTVINTATSGTTNYFFTPTNSCDDPLILNVTVTACGCMNPAIVNIDPITSICENETIALNAVLSGTATTATWSTAGDGSFDNTTSTTPIYTPGATDISNGAVSLSVLTGDPDGAGPCTSATASVLLLIDNLVNPTFSIENSYCEGDVTDVLPANSNNGIAGTWSPATISNVNSDMYEFTPDVGECANPFMLNVTVNPNNTPVFTITNTYCVNDPADVLPTTSNNGVVGTWSPTVINTATSGTTNYFFTPTNSCNDQFILNVTVTACGCMDPAIVNIDPITSICENETIALNAVLSGTATTATWSTAGDGNFDNTTSTTPIYTPGATDISNGAVSLSVLTDDTDGAGPCTSAMESVNLVINSLATPTFSIDNSYCEGDVTDVLPANSNNGIAGTWSPATISNVSSDMYVFTPDAGECANPFTLNVTINDCGCADPGTVAIDPINSICENEILNLNAVIGGLATTVTWMTTGDGNFNNTTLTSPTYTPGATDIANGIVTLSVLTDDPDGTGPCAAATDDVDLVINNLVDPTFEITDAYCSGDVTDILATVSDNGITGTWTPSVIDNTTSNTYIFNPDAGQCANTYMLNVVISNLDVPTFAITDDYCIGDVADVLPINSDNGIAGTWTPNVISTVNAGNIMYIFTPSGNCGQPYMLNVTINDCACLDPALVNITPVTTICENELIGLNAILGGSATMITWTTSNGSGTFDNINAQNAVYTPSATDISNGSVMFTATTDDPDDTGLCSPASSNINVNITTLTDPTFAISNNYCQGDMVDMLNTNSNNGISGTWLPSTIDNNASGMYVFTPDLGECASPYILNVSIDIPVDPIFNITDNYCAGDVVDVLNTNADNGVIGTWAPSVIDNMNSGDYTFTPSMGSCANEFNLSVTIDPCIAPCSINAVAGNAVCNDNNTPTDPSDDTFTFDITVTGMSTSGSWMSDDVLNTSGTIGTTLNMGPFSIANGDFDLLIQDATDPNCNTTVSIAAPAACSTPCTMTLSYTSTGISCFEDTDGSISLDIMGANGTPTIVWNIANVTGANPTNLGAATYMVTVTDDLGCEETETITIASVSEIFAVINTVDVGCANTADGIIEITNTTGGNSNYSYSIDGINFSNETMFTDLAAGTYTVWVQDALACNWSDEVQISQSSGFDVNITNTSTQVVVEETILLTGTTSLDPSEIASIQWSPTEGMDCPTCLETSLVADLNTTYSLTVVDIYGCSSTDEIMLTLVLPEFDIYIPNVFSPNGDGNNDKFTLFTDIENDAIIQKLSVYDRWGELIFIDSNIPLNDSNYGWDGTFKGEPVVDGVYVWVAQILKSNGDITTMAGDISVIR